MADIATLSFAVDTRPLLDVDAVLTALQKNATSTEAALTRMAASTRTAFANVAPGMASMLGGGGGSGSVTTSSTNQATAAIGAQTTALQAATTAHKSHGAAAYQNSLAMMEVAHVGRALFDEMAAGGNIFRALAMESGRLQIAISQGGLLSAIGGIGGKIAGFVNPLTLGVGALAGLGSAALLASSHVRDLNGEMNRAVGGAGRLTGLSGFGLEALTESLASKFDFSQSGVGIGELRTGAMALARTGKLGQSSIGDVLGELPGYAGASGESLDKAGESLARIFANPTRGMGELEKVIGALDDSAERDQPAGPRRRRGRCQAAGRPDRDQPERDGSATERLVPFHNVVGEPQRAGRESDLLRTDARPDASLHGCVSDGRRGGHAGRAAVPRPLR